MALTTDDLKNIKHVIHEVVDAAEERIMRKTETAVGDLAIASQKQFLAHDVRFDDMDKRFDDIDARLDTIDTRLDHIEDNVVVVKDMVKDHTFRIAKLEHRLS
jgi:chaperonin cofactor prefoldin